MGNYCSYPWDNPNYSVMKHEIFDDPIMQNY